MAREFINRSDILDILWIMANAKVIWHFPEQHLSKRSVGFFHRIALIHALCHRLKPTR